MTAQLATLTKLRVRRAGLVDRPLSVDKRVKKLLAADAPVAIGVSGGKDSCALALATVAHLDAIGHQGPRVLVHADLGRVEWKDSLPTCERLAARLGLELLVVRREQGDMMDRWLQRWRDNLRRYTALSCVKVILPWSTPSMRFCTSELKTTVICRALADRFPGRAIVSAAGIRREESADRAKADVSKDEPDLTKVKLGTSGVTWNPILDWTETDVRAYCASRDFDLHEGYTRFGMTRISCAFCIMATIADLTASASCPENVAIYREMVELEIASAFAFQGSRWLGDVAPHLLDQEQRDALRAAKRLAEQRAAIEAQIPDHLLYERGWPKVMPTQAEAELLCRVRREVAALYEIEVGCTEVADLLARYADLIVQKAAKEAAKATAEAKRQARKRASKAKAPAA
ncbi:MAG TPA: phosphoadenosine phosphosulfate reductase family protein [Gaiellaceae bacterium]|nr:phosphoadenosine phosphosulfate reductase family protein [Gaiellaceae bacterium]